MKNPVTKMQLWTAVIFLSTLLMQIIVNAQMYEDEIDTTGIVVETEVDGMDTVWYLDDGTDPAYMRSTNTQRNFQNTGYSSSARFGIGYTGTMNINIGHTLKTVEKGLMGYHLGGIYDNATIPNDSSSEDQWQWLIDLKPESVRVFSGSYSKFMHLLDGPGYGYDLDEIIRYFDKTDDTFDAPPIDTILLYVGDTSFLNEWILEDEVGSFQSYVNKCLAQNNLDTNRRYIDDFIEMIRQVDSAWDYQVKVIVCLNIMSSTATECKDIIEYLRDNPIHDLNVVYVEMGNEVYFNFMDNIMDIGDFDEYWAYINGDDYVGIDSILLEDVYTDHNYISAFKSDPGFTCKVGIPARNLGPGFVFASSDDDGVFLLGGTEWNDDLATHYTDSIQVGTGGYVKKFDAVILHPYYDQSNWKQITDSTLESTYACDSLWDADTTNDQWTLGIYDERLEECFDSISVNFRNLFKHGYLDSYDEHNTHLKFYLSVASGGKELITTEYNFKDGDGNNIPDRQGVFTHGFMHGYLLMEWALKNMKLNVNTNYRAGFFKYATVQNYAGAAGPDLISPANSDERISLDVNVSPYTLAPGNPASRNYHMKRTTYFSMQLLSEINKNNLKLVQGNYPIFTGSINIHPTIFIDETKSNFYIYYSNISDTVQRYVLNLTGTSGIYPGGYGAVIIDTATIYCVNALQNYSTSGKGKNTLYDLNQCYDSTGINFPIEIDGIDTLLNNPGGGANRFTTIDVPAYSFGYFKVPIQASNLKMERELTVYDVNLFPNPANDKFKISALDNNGKFDFLLHIEIRNTMGALCARTTINNGQEINITSFSAGVYNVLIIFDDGTSVVRQFVKQ